MTEVQEASPYLEETDKKETPRLQNKIGAHKPLYDVNKGVIRDLNFDRADFLPLDDTEENDSESCDEIKSPFKTQKATDSQPI